MASPGRRSRYEIEDELRLRVEQATADFKRANAERDRLFAISRDVCCGTDGALAIQQAMRVQREALIRLQEALHDLEAFTLPRRWIGPSDLPSVPHP